MNCPHCKARNAEGEHRCRVCGRLFQRASGGARYTVDGPLAVAPAAHARVTVESAPARDGHSQGVLFPAKVVALRPGSTEPERRARPRRRASDSAATAGAIPRQSLPTQTGLEFPAGATRGPRPSRSTVEPVIACSEPVATPMHRTLAALLDWSLIVVACAVFFAVFAAAFYLQERSLPSTRGGPLPYAAVAAVVVAFYFCLWFLAGGGTPGTRLLQLKIINFSGLPPDSRERTARFFGVLLSYAAGSLGLLWALVDEESLTWHDHMSNTFPTYDRRQ